MTNCTTCLVFKGVTDSLDGFQKARNVFFLLRTKKYAFLSLMKDPGSAGRSASQNVYMPEI